MKSVSGSTGLGWGIQASKGNHVYSIADDTLIADRGQTHTQAMECGPHIESG